MEKKEKLFFIFQIFLRIQTSYSQRLNKTSNEIVFGHARAIPYDTECPDLFNVPTPDYLILKNVSISSSEIINRIIMLLSAARIRYVGKDVRIAKVNSSLSIQQIKIIEYLLLSKHLIMNTGLGRHIGLE